MRPEVHSIRASTSLSLAVLVLSILAVHVLSYILSGYQPVQRSWQALGLLLAFSVLVVTVLLLPARDVALPTGRPWVFRILDNERTLTTLVVVTAIGVAIHTASKLYFISSTRLECIASLHAIWLERPRTGNPAWVEFASRVGHVLSGFAFAGSFAAAFATMVRQQDRWRRSMMKLALLFVLGQSYAFIIMSRSSMLLLLIGFTAGALLGVAASGHLRRAVGRVAILVGLAALVTFGLANARAYSNIHCLSKLPAVDAMTIEQQGFYRMLPMRRINDARSNPFWAAQKAADGGDNSGASSGNDRVRGPLLAAAGSVERLCPSCALVQTYLNHAIWNFEWYAFVGADAQDGSLLLKPLRAWYKRLSVDDNGPEVGGERGFGAGGITLPGAFYHDLGISGVLIGAVLLGLAGRASGALMLGGRLASAVGVILYVCVVGAIGYMFMMPVWSVMAFPFATGALIVTFVCAGVVSRSP